METSEQCLPNDRNVNEYDGWNLEEYSLCIRKEFTKNKIYRSGNGAVIVIDWAKAYQFTLSLRSFFQ